MNMMSYYSPVCQVIKIIHENLTRAQGVPSSYGPEKMFTSEKVSKKVVMRCV